MASGDVSPSKLPGLPRNKISKEIIDTVRDLIEEIPNSSISLPTLPLPVQLFQLLFPSELVNTVEDTLLASIKIESLLL